MTLALKGGARSSNKLELRLPADDEEEIEQPVARQPVKIELKQETVAVAETFNRVAHEPPPSRPKWYRSGLWSEALKAVFAYFWLSAPLVPWYFWLVSGATAWYAQATATVLLLLAATRLSLSDANLSLGERIKTWVLSVLFVFCCWFCFPVAVFLALIGTALHFTLAGFKLFRSETAH